MQMVRQERGGKGSLALSLLNRLIQVSSNRRSEAPANVPAVAEVERGVSDGFGSDAHMPSVLLKSRGAVRIAPPMTSAAPTAIPPARRSAGRS